MRKKTRMQSLVVGLSSLLYFLPVRTSLRSDAWWIHTVGSILYSIIALASTLADGGFADPPWTTGSHHYAVLSGRLQILDRWTATAGLVYIISMSVWPLVSIQETFVHGVITFAVLFFLHRARHTHVDDTWQWVFWQSLWHLASSVAIASLLPGCGGLYCVLQPAACK